MRVGAARPDARRTPGPGRWPARRTASTSSSPGWRAPTGAHVVNAIADQLGKVGLPAPVSELAARQWDVDRRRRRAQRADLRGLPRPAGKSVLVLEARERLGGACTLEQPFGDERYVISPCAYVIGLLDEEVIRDLEAEPARPRGLRRRSAAVGAVRRRHRVRAVDGPRADRRRACRSIGISGKEIDGYVAYEKFFDDMRLKLRKGARDTWVGDSPSRAELEEILGDQLMIDALFDGVDRRRARRVRHRPTAQGRIVRAGRDRHLRRAARPGHRVGEADALPGRPARRGPDLGLRPRRHGHGQLRDRRRRAGRGRGARGRRAGRRDRARRGRAARGRHVHRRADRGEQRRPEAGARHGGRRRDAGRLPRPARGLGHPQPGREVQRGAVAAAVVDRRAGRDVHGARHRRRHHRTGRRAGRVRALRRRRGRRSDSARSTCRRCTIRRPRRPAST